MPNKIRSWYFVVCRHYVNHLVKCRISSYDTIIKHSENISVITSSRQLMMMMELKWKLMKRRRDVCAGEEGYNIRTEKSRGSFTAAPDTGDGRVLVAIIISRVNVEHAGVICHYNQSLFSLTVSEHCRA